MMMEIQRRFQAQESTEKFFNMVKARKRRNGSHANQSRTSAQKQASLHVSWTEKTAQKTEKHLPPLDGLPVPIHLQAPVFVDCSDSSCSSRRKLKAFQYELQWICHWWVFLAEFCHENHYTIPAGTFALPWHLNKDNQKRQQLAYD